LLEDHEANRETVKLFELRANNLQNELEDYQQKVEEQAKVIEDSEEAIKRLQESQDNVINSEKLAKDLLKASSFCKLFALSSNNLTVSLFAS
jgi:hypothetical protein